MSKGGNQNTTSVKELTPEQQELMGYVLPIARDYATNPPSPYPGSTIAPFDPLQLFGQDQALATANNLIQPLAYSTIGQAQNLAGSTAAGQEGVNTLLSGLQYATPAQNFLLSGAALSPESNPYLAATADAAVVPLEEKLMERILPSIRGEAINAGGVGSSRQGIAEGNAIEAFNRDALLARAGIYSGGYGQGLNAMVDTLGKTLGAGTSGTQAALEAGAKSLFAIPDLANFALRPSEITQDVGGTRRAMEQAILAEQADRYVNDQLIPFLMAQDIAGLAMGWPGGSVTSTSPTPGIDPFTALVGGGSTIAALWPLLAGISDRRLKQNIRRVGSWKKTPLYVFEYKATPGVRHIGVMADEVPHAVIMGEDGYALVNYAVI